MDTRPADCLAVEMTGDGPSVDKFRAMVRVLVRKGICTQEEIIEAVEEVRREMVHKRGTLKTNR